MIVDDQNGLKTIRRRGATSLKTKRNDISGSSPTIFYEILLIVDAHF